MSRYTRIGILSLVVLFGLFGFTKDVNAKDNIYYTSSYGVELTEKEYNFLVKMYNEDFPKNMTKEEYNMFAEENHFDDEIVQKKVSDKNTIMPQGTFHSTSNKSVQISRACGSSCTITITVQWFGDPSVKSYDVIGAYLSGVSSYGTITTRSTSTTSSTNALYTRVNSNGVGASLRVPTAGVNISLYQTFSTTTGGHIYASYQHAMSNTTLAISKQYNFSRAGYGGVFAFYGDARGVYDGMNGVDIAV